MGFTQQDPQDCERFNRIQKGPIRCFKTGLFSMEVTKVTGQPCRRPTLWWRKGTFRFVMVRFGDRSLWKWPGYLNWWQFYWENMMMKRPNLVRNQSVAVSKFPQTGLDCEEPKHLSGRIFLKNWWISEVLNFASSNGGRESSISSMLVRLLTLHSDLHRIRRWHLT